MDKRPARPTFFFFYNNVLHIGRLFFYQNLQCSLLYVLLSIPLYLMLLFALLSHLIHTSTDKESMLEYFNVFPKVHFLHYQMSLAVAFYCNSNMVM